MAYTKKTWIDRNVQYPTNYVATKSGGGALSSGDTLTMTASPGTITEAGDPLTASDLNNMEDGIENANNPSYQAEATTAGEVVAIPNTAEDGELDCELRGETISGYDSNTTLLLYFEGADTSTTFTDETGKTVAASGNAQLDTAQYRFGTSSALFDGTGDYLTVTDANSELDIGTDDFTIEYWIRWNDRTGAQGLIDFRTSTPSVAITMYKKDTHEIGFYVNGVYEIESDTLVEDDIWYHVAVARTSATTKLFINGKQEGGDYSDSNNYLAVTNFRIGDQYTGGVGFNGWLDHFRVSNSARYTSNFRPISQEIVSTGIKRIKSIGLNMFDSSKVDYDFQVDNTDGTETASVGENASDFIRIDPDNACHISGCGGTTNTDGAFYDYSKNYLSGFTSYGTLTVPDNAEFLRFTVDNDDMDTAQVEIGSSASTFEAYKETIASSELALKSVNATHYDSFNYNTGRYTKNIEEHTLLSGDIDSVGNGSNVQYAVIGLDAFSSIIAQTGSTIDGTTLVSRFKAETDTVDLSASEYKWYTNTNDLYLMVPLGTWADVAAARTALTSTNTTKVFYKLDETTVTDYASNAITTYTSGSVYNEQAIEEVLLYDTDNSGIKITNTGYPIDSIDSCYEITPITGKLVWIDPDTITIASGSLSFTISGASTGEKYKFAYYYRGEGSNGTLAYSYNNSVKSQIESNMSQVLKLNKKVDMHIDATPTMLWEKIAEVTLDATAAQIDFSTLEEHWVEFKLIMEVSSSGATSRDLYVEFNDDSASNYEYIGITYTGASITNVATSAYINIQRRVLCQNSDNFIGTAEVFISNIESAYKNLMYEMFAGSHREGCHGVGSWRNATSKINKISLTPSADSFDTGSKISLYGRRA